MTSFILIIDDQENLRGDLRWKIEKSLPECEVTEARNEIEAVALLLARDFDVVVADLKLDEAGGTETGGLKVLEVARKKDPLTQVIVVTAFGGIPVLSEDDPKKETRAVDYAKQLGAFACIDRNLPGVNFLNMVEDTVRAAVEKREALLVTSPRGLPEEIQIVANFYTVANLGDALVPAREGELSTERGIPTWHVKVLRKKTRQLRGELHISQDGKHVEWKEKGDRDAPA